MLRLPAIISNKMVLEQKALIFGHADCEVTLSFRGKTYKTAPSDKGRFEFNLNAGEYGGPFELIINDIILRDVYVGYVWLCGGQSNMELPIGRVRRMFEDDLKDVYNPHIRAFTVETNYIYGDGEPKDTGAWKEAANENINDFYAVPYFFARRLYDTYNIPIGLVCCAAGGSKAEGWYPPNLLRDDMYREYSILAASDIKAIEAAEEKKTQGWFAELDALDTGVLEHWEKTELDDSAWDTRELTAPFDNDLNINGSVWFRKGVYIPAEQADREGVIELGVCVDSDYVYINGALVGHVPYRYPPSIFTIPKGILKPGENTIAVRVLSHNGIGGFVSDKSYHINNIPLTGKWRYRIGAVMPQAPAVTPFYLKPSGFYNGMLKQVMGYSISGVIWYQGESNTDNPDDYYNVMEKLIGHWREVWGENLPFIFVQLANFEANSNGAWARLRQCQFECLKIKNTAMAVAIDCGEGNDLHPLDKKTVGERLALCARALAYGDNVIYKGPAAKAVTRAGERLLIEFDNAEGGLKTSGDTDVVIEIETVYGGLFKVQGVIEGSLINIYCPAAHKPAYIRYAFADNPRANLYNNEGLPAIPFRLMVKDN